MATLNFQDLSADQQKSVTAIANHIKNGWNHKYSINGPIPADDDIRNIALRMFQEKESITPIELLADTDAANEQIATHLRSIRSEAAFPAANIDTTVEKMKQDFAGKPLPKDDVLQAAASHHLDQASSGAVQNTANSYEDDFIDETGTFPAQRANEPEISISSETRNQQELPADLHFLPSLDQQTLEHLIASKQAIALNADSLPLLLSAIPGLALNPAVIKLLQDKAKELEIPFDVFMQKSREGVEMGIDGNSKGATAIDPRAIAMQTFMQNTSLLSNENDPNAGFASFTLLTAENGKVTSFHMDTADNVRYTHKDGVTSIFAPPTDKTTEYIKQGKRHIKKTTKTPGRDLNEDDILRAMRLHVQMKHASLQDLPQNEKAGINLQITLANPKAVKLRDMAIISALIASKENGIPVTLDLWGKRTFGLKHLVNDNDGPSDIPLCKNGKLLVFEKLDHDVIASMQARGVDVHQLVNWYNESHQPQKANNDNLTASEVLSASKPEPDAPIPTVRGKNSTPPPRSPKKTPPPSLAA